MPPFAGPRQRQIQPLVVPRNGKTKEAGKKIPQQSEQLKTP